MDTFTCPGCNAPLKLALVPAVEPSRQDFTPPDRGAAEPGHNPPSEPSPRAPSPLAERPDIVAQKEGVAKLNAETADHLKLFVEETGGWFDPLPSPAIFDKFQAWAVAKYGRPLDYLSKHRLSKALVESLGATWHKTGKGRMYLLPAELRPATRPASEDYATVPVAPAPSTPRVVEGEPAVEPPEPGPPAVGVEEAAASVYVPVNVSRRTEWQEAQLAELDRAAGAAGDGPLQFVSPPFIDFPESGTASDITVTAEGVFDTVTGARLPGDDGPAADAVVVGSAEWNEKLAALGDSLGSAPLVSAASYKASLDEAFAAREAADGLVLHPQDGNVVVGPDGSVTQEHGAPEVWVDSPATETAETGGGDSPEPRAELVEPLPAGWRKFSVKLSAEQVGWPLRDIARVFDQKLPEGLVRLGALADIELRKIMGGPYATALVADGDAPGDNSVAVGPETVELLERTAAATPAAAPLVEPAPAAVPVLPARERQLTGEFVLAISEREADLPFGALELLFVNRLPGGMIPSMDPVELIRVDGAPALRGRVLVPEGAAAVPAAPSSPPVDDGAVAAAEAEAVPLPDDVDVVPAVPARPFALVGASVHGAGVDEAAAVHYDADAAAVALASYRAAAAAVLPAHIADPGDWG